jgi:hypothetical protein
MNAEEYGCDRDDEVRNQATIEKDHDTVRHEFVRYLRLSARCMRDDEAEGSDIGQHRHIRRCAGKKDAGSAAAVGRMSEPAPCVVQSNGASKPKSSSYRRSASYDVAGARLRKGSSHATLRGLFRPFGTRKIWSIGI